jgi:ABC-type multidrug transport system ATPase subunit
MLEARAIHTGRSAYNHLLALAQTHGIGRSRVNEVIDLVGIHDVARKRVGGFSLGMGQRPGVAAALLGDPGELILDEPANGLDPEGIMWIRTLLKRLAKEGRTVFLPSHLMAEMAQTAEHLVVIGRGRLIADTSVAEFVEPASTGAAVRVVSMTTPIWRRQHERNLRHGRPRPAHRDGPDEPMGPHEPGRPAQPDQHRAGRLPLRSVGDRACSACSCSPASTAPVRSVRRSWPCPTLGVGGL